MRNPFGTCPKLPKLFNEFYENKLVELANLPDLESKKKLFIFSLFIGAFPEIGSSIDPEIIEGFKLIYTNFNVNQKGGSKKRKQIHKKKSKKSRKTKKLN